MAEQSPYQSKPSAAKLEKRKASQFVAFQIGEQHYAFPIEQIQEIVIIDQITRMPQVADYVEGVSNLRGAIIPIINLRKLLGLDLKPADAETRTIVVNVGERTMGCTVDTVSHVIRIPDENIQAAPETVTAGAAGYVAGFAKFDDRLVILLDIDELLDPAKLESVRES